MKSTHKYISKENEKKMLEEILSLLPMDYINMIRNKDNKFFINEINNPKLYDLKTQCYETPNSLNFIDCIIIRKTIMELLKKNKNKQIIDKLISTNIKYCIIKNKIICAYKEFIYIGILNEKNIFHSEIIIKYNDLATYNLIINDLKNNSFDYFVNNINITNNNKGKYKDANNELIILDEKYLIKQNIPNMPNIPKQPIKPSNYNTHNPSDNTKKRPMSSNKYSKNVVNKNIKILLYIMIDMNKIKKKVENSLKINKYKEKYYPVNSEILEQYLKNNNFLRIYQNQKLNSIINNCDANDLSNEEIFININSYFEGMNIPNGNILFKKDINNKKIWLLNNIFCFNNFILLSSETINLLNNISTKEFEDITYSFNDKKIYMIFNQSKCIEIYNLNQQNYITLEFFFVFDSFYEFKNQLSNITKIGYKSYLERYTIFKKEDYSSPIFINDNKNVGYAYNYNNYNNTHNSKYLENFTLISMIKLYFTYEERKIKENTFKNGKYNLINNQLIKEIKSFYNYSTLENELNNINEAKIIINIIKNENNNINDLLSNKKIHMIIQELSNQILAKFKEKYKENINDFIKEEPELKAIDNKYIMYYNDFELIPQNIYNILFKNKNNDYSSNNYINIYSTKKYIYFQLPEIINESNSQKFILEIGSLKENIFIPNYILVYSTKENYEYAINNFTKKNDLDYLLDNFNFEENNSGILYDGQNNEIGLIYNLKNNQKKINKNNNNNTFRKSFNNNNNNYNNKYNNRYNNENKKIINNYNILSNDNIKPQQQNNNFFNIQNNFISVSIPEPRLFSPSNNNMSKIEFINNIKNIKQEFSKPLLIGLQSIGDSPLYMNAVLQCFCQIDKLVDYIKYKQNVQEKIETYKNNKRINLISSFKLLIDNLWPSQGNSNYLLKNNNNYYFAPYGIKDIFYLLNPGLKNSTIPNDLIDLILNHLHNELNKNSQNNMCSNSIINFSDKLQVFNNFFQNFKDNRSIISGYFFGIYQKSEICSVCQNPYYNYNSFHSLYFDLWKIKSFKIEKQQFNNYYTENLNIYDCFEYHRRIEYQIGNNILFCQKCQNNNKYYQETIIFSAPIILIISLNLTKELQNQIKFDLYENITLNNYLENNKDNSCYDLRGIVAYNLQNGKYIAFCKSPIDQRWYKYNDDYVCLMDNNIISEINSSFFPCVLFYQKK